MRKVALVVALVLAGCAGTRRSAEQQPETRAGVSVPPALASSPTAAAPRTAPATDSGVSEIEAGRPVLSRRLELQQAGKEPLRALRHVFTKGSRQRLRVEIVTRVLENGRALAEARIEAPLEVTIAEVRGDGSADFRYALGPIHARGPGAGPLAFVSDAGKSPLSGSGTIAPNGELRDYRPDGGLAEGAPEAEVLRSLFSTVIELPPSPVGQGGRWELVLEGQASEIAIVNTTSYELLGFAGSRVKIRVGQNEQIRMPDGGALNQLVTAPSAGEWMAELGRVFPAGRQAMKAGILTDVPGEIFTEIRLVPR
jgi:hypothetical protein